MANEEKSPSDLFRRISRLRWQAALLALILVFIHQWVEHAYLYFLPRWTHFWTQVVVYGVVGPTLAWVALSSLRRQVAETERAERILRRSRDQLASVNQQLEILIDVERKLAEAVDEEELLQAILDLPLIVLPAIATSLVRFDLEGNPLPAIHQGRLPPDEFVSWTAHLAAPATADECASCRAHRASQGTSCPLLSATPDSLRAKSVYCLPLRRGMREFGVVIVYLVSMNSPSPAEAELLDVMADGMSLALESQMLRSRELDALTRVQQVGKLEGLASQLRALLANLGEAVGATGGAFYMTDGEESGPSLATRTGDEAPFSHDELLGMALAVRESLQPMMAHQLRPTSAEEGNTGYVVAAPLRREERWLGSLLLWSETDLSLSARQLKLLGTIASQATLLIENHRLYRQVEYTASVAERTRLAREIHDGLAQTLGYLKLRAAQLRRWVESRPKAEVLEAVEDIRRLLDEAFVDAREAIDGLRIDPAEGDFSVWLERTYSEFREGSEIDLEASLAPSVDLPLEVQYQMQRIVQEALGNVRKHSGASKVLVRWRVDPPWLLLSVSDDGCGFDPADVPPISRHGIRIMRERADLLGAEFQIVSRSEEGTEVVVRLPLKELTQDRPHV